MSLVKNEVYVMALGDGTEMVGRCTEVDDSLGFITLERPLKVLPIPVPQRSQDGVVMAVTMQMVPAFPYSGQREFELKLSHLLVQPTVAPKQVADAWMQMTSGIQIAS